MDFTKKQTIACNTELIFQILKLKNDGINPKQIIKKVKKSMIFYLFFIIQKTLLNGLKHKSIKSFVVLLYKDYLYNTLKNFSFLKKTTFETCLNLKN